MSEALALRPTLSIVEVESLSKNLAKSTLLPVVMRGRVEDVLLTIMAGQELGLPPIAALRMIHVIEGKPVLSADAMAAVILGSGRAEYFRRTAESDTSVTYETKRIGASEPRSCTWTIAMAKQAGLSLKDNWRAYPRAMLASRAKAELARDVYPDVLAGCYTQDEVDNFKTPAPRAEPSNDERDVIDATFVDVPKEPEKIATTVATTVATMVANTGLAKIAADVIVEINSSENAEQVKKCGELFTKLPKGTPERLAALNAYTKRLAECEAANA